MSSKFNVSREDVLCWWEYSEQATYKAKDLHILWLCSAWGLGIIFSVIYPRWPVFIAALVFCALATISGSQISHYRDARTRKEFQRVLSTGNWNYLFGDYEMRLSPEGVYFEKSKVISFYWWKELKHIVAHDRLLFLIRSDGGGALIVSPHSYVGEPKFEDLPGVLEGFSKMPILLK